MAAKKTTTLKATMPPDCCGNCVFSKEVKGSEYLMCFAMPPTAHPHDELDEVEWIRGGSVGPTDPRCYFFAPKTGLN